MLQEIWMDLIQRLMVWQASAKLHLMIIGFFKIWIEVKATHATYTYSTFATT